MAKNKTEKYEINPKADENAVVKGDKYRFTILTSRLIRIEYCENGKFEDRATQTVINRKFDIPEFTVTERDGELYICTKDVQLVYNKQPFSRYSLKARYIGENSAVKAGGISTYWYFGDEPRNNLKGTTKTLDDIDGECVLENGIMSMGEICVLDDGGTLAVNEDGWVEQRCERCIDQYLFCYGSVENKYDYKTCLKDFYKLTGRTPLIPRYALGNWWSRYHAYTQDEYIELMQRFKDEDIPFGVAVIDMDWHLVKIDPQYGTGWTGYTWNEELFPDHRAFLKFLHNEGMGVTLNLHPQQGVAAHEKQYSKMAEAMGIDPETEECVEFDVTSPRFMKNYFEILHHPLEDDGVDFWWLDWQQGNTTSIPGLDPLWMLNHYHYADNGRTGKRPMVFSRYSGPGSHRYPVGFSGDTYVTWESLAFQPYFTANASNIGYGWWSHDIGGHQVGYRDNELAGRWIQFGVFSPINRLHSGCNIFLAKEPWRYDKITETSMKKFLKLRHQLIPYLYSMNYRAHKYGEPLITPLYYNWNDEAAYNHKNEYSFGTEMLVSPIVKPNDKDTAMGSTEVYLPDGDWYDFFSNMRYIGGRNLSVYRDMYSMPVFVKAGGIVPMTNLSHINDTENPENMKIKVFAGGDNVFELYEDDGFTQNCENGKFAITKMQLKWGEKPCFEISEPEGDKTVTCESRNFEIEFVGINENTDITVTENGKDKAFSVTYNTGVLTVEVQDVSKALCVSFNSEVSLKRNDVVEKAVRILEQMQIASPIKNKIHDVLLKNEKASQRLADILAIDMSHDVLLAVTEIISADTYGE